MYIYIYTYLYILYLHVMWVRLKVCGPKILWFLFETTHFIAKATLQISNQQTWKQKQIKRTKHWKNKIWGAPVSFSLSYSLYDSKFPNINHHVMRLNDEYRKDTYWQSTSAKNCRLHRFSLRSHVSLGAFDPCDAGKTAVLQGLCQLVWCFGQLWELPVTKGSWCRHQR